MPMTEAQPQHPIFAHLDEKDRMALVESAISRRYSKGQWICHHGDIWPYLFRIVAGEVAAVKESREGRSLIAMTLSQGEVFWGLAFFLDRAEMPVALIADEPCELRLWHQSSLLPILLQAHANREGQNW